MIERANSKLFGRAFEHFLVTEIRAHARYSGMNYPLVYWRTVSQIEVERALLAVDQDGWVGGWRL